MTTTTQKLNAFAIDGRPFRQDRLDAALAAYEKARANLARFNFTHCRCSEEQLVAVGCDCDSGNPSDEDAMTCAAERAAIMPQATPLAVFDFGPDFARSGVSSRYGYRAVRDVLFGAEPVAFNAAGLKAWTAAKAEAEARFDEAAGEVESASYDPARSF